MSTVKIRHLPGHESEEQPNRAFRTGSVVMPGQFDLALSSIDERCSHVSVSRGGWERLSSNLLDLDSNKLKYVKVSSFEKKRGKFGTWPSKALSSE